MSNSQSPDAPPSSSLSLGLTATKVSKHYRRRKIFSNINLEIRAGETLAIVGHNGSGKSTLLKILALVLSPSSGSVEYTKAGQNLGADQVHQQIGFAAPYLRLYEEFSAHEHLALTASLRGNSWTEADSTSLLQRCGLDPLRREDISAYSSGMQQRLKLATAIQHQPAILFLDEPSATLDSDGVDVVRSIVEEQTARGGGVVLATNDDRDRAMCVRSVALEDYV